MLFAVSGILFNHESPRIRHFDRRESFGPGLVQVAFDQVGLEWQEYVRLDPDLARLTRAPTTPAGVESR